MQPRFNFKTTDTKFSIRCGSFSQCTHALSGFIANFDDGDALLTAEILNPADDSNTDDFISEVCAVLFWYRFTLCLSLHFDLEIEFCAVSYC